MKAKAFRVFKVSLPIVLMLLAFPDPASPGAVKLKVTIDGSAIYLNPNIASRKLVNVPQNTVLDSDGKEGDFYKVTLVQKGASISGYIHQDVVEQITDSEAERLSGEASAGAAAVKSQPEIIAHLDDKIEEYKELVKADKDLSDAAEGFRSLIPALFSVDDHNQQRQRACSIYYWIGVALTKSGDLAGAKREFRNMWAVDTAYAAEATKDVFDKTVSQLVNTAKKIQEGQIVSYTLNINTDPQGATILVDGQVIGKSPQIYSTTNANLTLEAQKDGFAPVKKPIFLTEANSTVSLPLQSMGRTVRISSTPAGAEIFLDDQDTGKVTECEIPFVRYGAHTIRWTMDGYADEEQSVQVSEGPDPLPVSAVLTANQYAPSRTWGGPTSKFFKMPKAIAVDRSDNLCIADESNYKVRKYDVDLVSLGWNDPARTLWKLDTPAGIAFDDQGNMYVTDAGDSCWAKFDRDGRQVGKWKNTGPADRELKKPAGIAVSKSGDVYVADTGSSRIFEYSPAGAIKRYWGKPGFGRGEFSYPTGVAVNAKNEIVVADMRGRIQKFTAEGVYISEFGSPGSGPEELSAPLGLCLDGDGYIYVADTGNHRVQKFSPDGRLIVTLGAAGSPGGPLTTPVGVAVNGKGDVFVVERDANQIRKFQIAAK